MYLIEKRVEIEYRRGTNEWRACAYNAHSSTCERISGWGNLRSPRRWARRWLQDHDRPTLFQTIRPKDLGL